MTYPLDLPDAGHHILRVWRPDMDGPSMCTLRGDRVIDVTTPATPTVRDLLETEDPVSLVADTAGTDLGGIAEIAANSTEAPDPARPHLLAPCDLQAVKACGVTFVASMLERVIEEQAEGDPARAEGLRDRCLAIIGDSLRDLVPGSPQAEAVKETLIAEGMWSQYLEVGIGPYAEVFTKGQPMSCVGWGASVGLHPISEWNNPEPEIVLAVDSRGRIRGATLGNDVNLRDVEGRSALLLGKAKDNNASCAVGPAIRLLDDSFGLDDIRKAELTLTVTGTDGYVLTGHSSMAQISRDPEDLVAQTCGPHHQYPDGFLLFLGTLFAPTEDRDRPGSGFTHKSGDHVRIEAPGFGTLENTVRRSPDCPPWEFGTAALMRNLAARGLI